LIFAIGGEFLAFCLAKCDIISKSDCKLFMDKFHDVAKDDGKLELKDLLGSDLMEADAPANHIALETLPIRPEESVI
jgi:hypothetical protein